MCIWQAICGAERQQCYPVIIVIVGDAHHCTVYSIVLHCNALVVNTKCYPVIMVGDAGHRLKMHQAEKITHCNGCMLEHQGPHTKDQRHRHHRHHQLSFGRLLIIDSSLELSEHFDLQVQVRPQVVLVFRLMTLAMST